VPILTMVSYSIVWRIGPESYFQRAADAGVDGVIIPELPADEGKEVARLAESNGLDEVFLVAPTTPPERMKAIAARSRGFIYYIAVAGTTGARNDLPPDLADHIARLKAATGKPIAVGFGISRPEQVAAVARVADGVIVGSALVRKVAELSSRPRAELVSATGDFVAELAMAKTRASGTR
jgi:tryptophan synthase alpha chain